MIREKECNARMLFDAICEISENKSRLQDMSAAMKALDRPDATDRIVDTILSLIGERNPNLR
jgi:UDP-N-acetylglucosamine:LPS N-acetylglucosamine transferase